MIYTITPNPALDLGGIVDSIVPNEKNYVRSETRYPGGNAINVARLLTRLKVPVLATGFLGKSVGSEIRDLLDEDGVEHRFVEIEGHTRINVTVSNLRTHQQTRLSFPGPHISPTEIRKLIQQVSKIPRNSIMVIGGSMPQGFQISDLKMLIAAAEKRDLRIALDSPGHLLRQLNLDRLLLIKPNLSEFQDLVKLKVFSISSVVRAAKRIADKVRFVCVSSVEGGALLVTTEASWFGLPPRVNLKTTVGAGDSMVAGMLSELHLRDEKDISPPDVLRSGLAAAAATLSAPGTQLGEAKAMRRFFNQVKIRRV